MSSKKIHPLQLVINDGSTFLNTGISVKFEIEEEAKRTYLYGKKIGEEIDGAPLGFPGYKFEIRGGSDIAGFPHIKGIPGPQLKQVLKSKPPGYRPRKYKVEKKTGGYKIINLKGVKVKKTVRGEELSERTRQVNLLIKERTGKNIEDMTEKEILSDKILAELVYKLGKTIMKWGLELPTFKHNEEKTPLKDKLSEVGITNEILDTIYKKLGIRLIKLGENRKKVIEPLRKTSRKHPHPLGRYIAWATYTLYQQLKNGEKNPKESEKLAEEFTNLILEGIQKWLTREMKKPPKFSFNIKEEE